MIDHKFLISSCILPMILAASPAVAQQAASDEVDNGGLDTIVVTAQRREERLQDIPVAVTAFSERAIEALRLTDAITTSKFVPGMISNHNAGLGSANTYYLRGLGNSQSTATFDAPVTTYVNDIYVARQNANNYAFFDTERVEILRGPQGTLFGRNTTGGAVNVILRKPADHYKFSAEATAGSFNRYTAKATVDAPLSEKAFSKLSAFYITDGGFVKNITTGENVNGEENWGVRGDLRLLASSDVTIDLGAEYTRNAGTYYGLRSVPGVSPYVVGGTTVPVFYETALGLPKGDCTSNNVNTLLTTGKGSCNLTKVAALNGKVAWNVGTGSIEWIVGWRHMNQGYSNQYDGNQTNKFASAFLLTDNGTNDQWSQELKYTGDLGDRVYLTTGAFYLQEATTDRQTTFSGGTTSFVATADSTYHHKVRTLAGYAQTDIKVSDPLTFTLGGRLTWEQKNVNYLPNNQFAPLASLFTDAQVIAAGLKLEQSITKFTPRAAINYKVIPDVMLFASATNGFKSGGWQGTPANASRAVTFRPENTWSYELGMKGDFLDHKLRVNVTGYYARTTDLQATALVNTLGASVAFNAGTQVVKGLEIETQARLGDLTLFANPSWMQARYTAISPLAATLTTALSPVRTPTFQFSGGAIWEHELEGLGTIGATAAWRHNSPYWIAVLNTARTTTENFVDLGVSLKMMDERITLAFDVSNLTDQKTVTANFLSLFPGDPRRYTARIKYKM